MIIIVNSIRNKEIQEKIDMLCKEGWRLFLLMPANLRSYVASINILKIAPTIDFGDW